MNVLRWGHTMEEKRPPRNKKLVTLLIFTPIIVAVTTILLLLNTLQTQFAPEAPKPLFTFNESSAPGWWAAENWHGSNDGSNVEQGEDKSLITGRNYFSGTREQPGTCFVMYFYKEGTVDAGSAIQDITDKSADKEAGESMQKLGTHNYTLQTFNGVKNFELHQYELVGGEANQKASGIEVAYVPLNEGYVEIRGHCEKADQLNQTLPLFEAVSLKK